MILTSWIQFIIFTALALSAIIFSIPGNVELGGLYFDSFDYDHAYEYFSRAQNDSGHDLKNLKRLKTYFLVRGDTRRALELQESLVKLKPKNRAYWTELRELYEWNLRPLDALRAREKETLLLPPDEQKKYWPEIAEGYRWHKAYADADRIFNLVAVSPSKSEQELALAYFFSRRKINEAQKLLAKNQNKEMLPVYRRWLAEIADSKGDPQAITLWRKVISDDFHEDSVEQIPSELLAKNLIALRRITDLLRENDPAKGREFAVRVSRSLEGNLAFTYDLAFDYLRNKNLPEALEAFRFLRQAEKNDERLFDVCNALGNLDESAEGINCLEEIVGRHPRNIRYLEALGDAYERAGDKERALRIFEKILRLQGEPDFTLIMYAEMTLIAQVSGPVPLASRPERSLNQLPESKLDRYRVRVISLREELGQGKKNTALLERLVKRQPKNISYLKLLGYHYLDQGEIKKGRELFQRILKINPRDSDAQKIRISELVDMKNYAEAKTQLERLTVEKDGGDLELRLDVFMETSDKDSARALCLKYPTAPLRFQVRCERNFGDQKLARNTLSQSLTKSSTDENRALLVSWLLEDGELTEGKRELALLRKSNTLRAPLQAELIRLEEEFKRRNAFDLRHTQQYALIPQNNFHLSSVELWKRWGNPGAGVHLEHLQGAHPWTRVTPFGSYRWRTFEAKLGPVFPFGEKNGGTSLLADLSWSPSIQSFVSIHHESKRPDYVLRELAREDSAMRELTSIYYSHFLRGNRETELSLTRNRYTFRGERGSDLQLYGNFTKVTGEHSFLGARLFAAKLSGGSDFIPRLHVQKALAYYLTAGLSTLPLDKKLQAWNFLARLSLGGDLERGIAPGEALNARGEANYHFDDERALRLSFDYTKESFLALVNEIRILELSYTTYF